MPHDLNDLRLFVLVASAKGYTAASRQSGVPRATLSRRIAALEAALGLRLIERSSRALRLSEPGERLYARARHLIAEADAAFDSLTESASGPEGVIRLAVPPSLLQLHLEQVLLDYLAARPGISLQIEATNRRVDLQRESFDLAIRAGQGDSGPQDQEVVPFASVEHVLAVAPALVPLLRPSLADSLRQLPVLAWAPAGIAATWQLRDHAGKQHNLPLAPRLMVEDMAMLHRATRAGLGLALLPRFMVAHDLAQGRLIAAEFDLLPPTGRIHAVHLGTRGMRPALRDLLDWLKRGYRALC